MGEWEGFGAVERAHGGSQDDRNHHRRECGLRTGGASEGSPWCDQNKTNHKNEASQTNYGADCHVKNVKTCEKPLQEQQFLCNEAMSQK